MTALDPAPVLRRSAHVSAFAHMGEIYLYHDIFGYILAMSPDVLALLEVFATPARASEVCARFAGRFDGAAPEQFVAVLEQFSCLVPAGDAGARGEGERDRADGGDEFGESDEFRAIWDMVPVRARWTVWHRESDRRLVFYTAWGERPPARHELDADETALWDDIDGERTARDLADTHGERAVVALVRRLVHHDVQALKLSPLPTRHYAGRPQLEPPYLKSTMPHAPYRPDAAGAADATGDASGDEAARGPGAELTPRAYYQQSVRDADSQFDHRETTLSHLFRHPHPALGGRSYGAALIDGLAARGWLPAPRPDPDAPLRVLEIGAGLGYTARAVLAALRARAATEHAPIRYEIAELSPALASAQRERLADATGPGRAVGFHHGDILELELPRGHYDLILANEMIGDLPAVRLSHTDIGLAADGLPLPADQRRDLLAKLGAAGRLIAELDLPLDDAPDPFYVNTGALGLLARVQRWLAPGGVAVLTEFGERARYPRLSTHLDHPELSIHFGHLEHAADRLGLAHELAFVIDLIDLDRDQRGLATTRSYFRALAAALADAGITLEKIGYTSEMFEALIRPAFAPGTLGEIHTDRIEDRVMGLVPHEFKALLLRHPAGERAPR